MDGANQDLRELAGRSLADKGAHPDPTDAAFAKQAFDRLMAAVAEGGDDVDLLGHALAVITAETFGGLCSLSVLHARNEMIYIAGLHDADPHALAMLESRSLQVEDERSGTEGPSTDQHR